MLDSFIKLLIQLLVIIIIAPFVTGVIKKLKALVQHRQGAPVLQLYYDIHKLLRKDMVISENASWIFHAAPYVYFISVLTAFAFLPVIPQLFSFNFAGDAILAVYLLAMGRLFLTLSGLDTGSTFGGMGSSREMMISSLMEPSMIVVIFTLGLSPLVGSTSFVHMFSGSAGLGLNLLRPDYLLLLASVLIVTIAETARIPVDDPATHLELTMVHEAMILEYSGRYLALMEYGSAIKQLFFITIIANVFMPFGSEITAGSMIAGILIYIAKVLVITVIIGLIEVNTVKMRIFSVPNLAALSFILALLGFMSAFIFGR